MRIGGLMKRSDLETYPLLVWLRSLAYSIFLRLILTLTSSAVPARRHPGRLDHLRGVLVAGVARDELGGSVSLLVPEPEDADLSHAMVQD